MGPKAPRAATVRPSEGRLGLRRRCARISDMTTYSVSDRMLRPVTSCLTLDVARRILDSRLDDDTQSRIDELARKANRGILTEEERQEYAEFVDYIDMVGIIKSEARLLLRQSSS